MSKRTILATDLKMASKLSIGLVLALHLLLLGTAIVSAEKVYGRSTRSSLLRPTRVTYGDIEKANKTCSPKDTCAPSRHNRNGAMLNDWKRRNCFCDQQCIVYEDCCVDSPYRRDPNVTYRKNDVFQCVTLRQLGSLYMKTKCPSSWEDETIRRGCEDPNSSFDPISSLPITNMKTGFTYKNYFCAICNNQTFGDRMEIWKPRLECPSINSKVGEKLDREEILDNLVYKADEGNWGIVNSQGDRNWSACKIDPVIPETVEYLVRFCKPSIRDCPGNYNNTEIHRKCLSYTGTVYHLGEGYRNVHCAICNGILPENLICDQYQYNRKAFLYEFDQAAFSMLFDLSPTNGLDVGKIQKCGKEEIYDPFFQKCRAILCQPGQFYRLGECVAASVSTTTTSTIEFSGDKNDLTPDQSNLKEHHISKNYGKDGLEAHKRFEKCPKIHLEADEYRVLSNGNIFIEKHNKTLRKGEYASVNRGHRLIVCAPSGGRYYVEKFPAAVGYVTVAGALISVICILAHLIACCMVPELRYLSGKNLASLCVALLVIYSVFLALPFVQVPSVSCTVIAVVLYYSLIAAFCWMLVLAWDVSNSLRKATQELRIASGSQWTRFFFYSAFGWLFPAVLVSIAVVTEFLPGQIMPWSFSPHFGEHNCWFGQKPSLMVYFVGPVGLILLLNVILFIDSARLIASTTYGTAKAKACGPSQRNFKLYVKLALLMGISWILGIVAGYVDLDFLWIIFIAFNTLQGLFIFVCFTCNAKVRKSIGAKLCCSSGSANPSWTWSNGVGRQHIMGNSTSSNGTKRSDLMDSKDSSSEIRTSPLSHSLHQIYHSHHMGRHHHHGPASMHAVGNSNGSTSLGGSTDHVHQPEKGVSKMYRSPSAELYRT